MQFRKEALTVVILSVHLFQTVWCQKFNHAVKVRDDPRSNYGRFTLRSNPGSPIFSLDVYTVSLFDNSLPSTKVVQVRATDPEGDKIRYSFQSGLYVYSIFTIDVQTGIISLKEADFSRSKYEFFAKAEDPEGLFSTAKVVVNIVSINAHKPEFLNCSQYSPSVREEEPEGTFVTQVVATDLDKGLNGEVAYSIVRPPSDTREDFSVHPKTGVITTSRVFDRDEPNNEKVFYVTVRAVDKGDNPLDDICVFRVTVIDINDNSPVFLQDSYSATVKQNAKSGTRIITMRATDIDADENGRLEYEFEEESDTFQIHKLYGLVQLKRELTNLSGKILNVIAKDNGVPRKMKSTILEIIVKPTSETPPVWEILPKDSIHVPENFTQGIALPAILRAGPGSPGETVSYHIVNGQTAQTNQLNTFMIKRIENGSAEIILASSLDYESITAYDITVQAKNSQLSIETIIKIIVEDVNDNFPVFTDIKQGSVLENQTAGTLVMTLWAVDNDGTSPFNRVTYSIVNKAEDMPFHIDALTGEIRTSDVLDYEDAILRKIRHTFRVTVQAKDGAPTSLPAFYPAHNTAEQDVHITVFDINDNPPHFNQSLYYVTVRENEDLGKPIAEFPAYDIDIMSQLIYSIENGNEDDTFRLESLTGELIIQKPLDYEKQKQYFLTISVSDSKYQSVSEVQIIVIDICDTPPLFSQTQYHIEINEIADGDELPQQLLQVTAERAGDNACKEVEYFVAADEKRISVERKTGLVLITEVLDRDEGNVQLHFTVYATYSDASLSVQNHTNINVTLLDVNDNPPTLKRKTPVVFWENRKPGQTVPLDMEDKDSPLNGPPFYCEVDISADVQTRRSFVLEETEPARYQLKSSVTFDREERKEYAIPFKLWDSGVPSMTGTSVLTVIIGDENDNPMTDGQSEIIVFQYKSFPINIPLGRVFVEDADDWDIRYKTFGCGPASLRYKFSVENNTGLIRFIGKVDPGKYELSCQVFDNQRNENAKAFVTINVLHISEMAAVNSGSLRIAGISPEKIIAKTSFEKNSIYDTLKKRLQEILKSNFELFGLQSYDAGKVTFTDLRYARIEEPFNFSTTLDGLVALNINQLKDLNINITMIGINGCFDTKLKGCEENCQSVTEFPGTYITSMSNRSSVVSVASQIKTICECTVPSLNTCTKDLCYNGGTCIQEGLFSQPKCICPQGFLGPYCERISSYFRGKDIAWFSSIPLCKQAEINFSLLTFAQDGIVMYTGSLWNAPKTTGYLKIELSEGRIGIEFKNYQNKIERFLHHDHINDGEWHHFSISWNTSTISSTLSNCSKPSCTSLLPNGILVNNGPFQIGGYLTKSGIERGFKGCLENVTFNGKFYDFANILYSTQPLSDCKDFQFGAIILTTDDKFIIAIIVCIIIFILLLLLFFGFVMYQSKKKWKTEDTEKEITENIIPYQEEEGEKDTNKYDLNLLREAYKAKEPTQISKKDLDEFVIARKSEIDKKNDLEESKDDGYLFRDDMRFYSYEGEGSDAGSLSSLSSGSDVSQDFEYLSQYGPRFRKLADMYTGHDSDSDTEHNADYI